MPPYALINSVNERKQRFGPIFLLIQSRGKQTYHQNTIWQSSLTSCILNKKIFKKVAIITTCYLSSSLEDTLILKYLFHISFNKPCFRKCSNWHLATTFSMLILAEQKYAPFLPGSRCTYIRYNSCYYSSLSHDLTPSVSPCLHPSWNMEITFC